MVRENQNAMVEIYLQDILTHQGRIFYYILSGVEENKDGKGELECYGIYFQDILTHQGRIYYYILSGVEENKDGKGELECYGRNIFMGYINKETDNQV